VGGPLGEGGLRERQRSGGMGGTTTWCLHIKNNSKNPSKQSLVKENLALANLASANSALTDSAYANLA